MACHIPEDRWFLATWLLIIAILAAMGISSVGCDQQASARRHRDPPTVDLMDAAGSQELPQRFEIRRYGQFNAGYNSNLREIIVIRDLETGLEYLGITGVGVSELRMERIVNHTTTTEE